MEWRGECISLRARPGFRCAQYVPISRHKQEKKRVFLCSSPCWCASLVTMHGSALHRRDEQIYAIEKRDPRPHFIPSRLAGTAPKARCSTRQPAREMGGSKPPDTSDSGLIQLSVSLFLLRLNDEPDRSGVIKQIPTASIAPVNLIVSCRTHK